MKEPSAGGATWREAIEVAVCDRTSPLGKCRSVPPASRCVGCRQDGTRFVDDHGLVVEPAARFMNVAESRTSAAVIDDDEMAGAEVGADEEAVWSPVWVQVHDQAQVGDNKSNWATVPTA